ncbi:MAG: ABC transporter ATP-binding protein, partial [Clostridia bacterium]|nr:ABC transporter ATP-binding protein [Clostridia bacterium]
INDKVKKYSLGMKQRLGVAMALLHNPKLLILDEPMNGLDPAGIKELRDIVTTLAHENGVGVLISSHQLAEMQNMCDRAAIIVSGRIICEDTLEALNRRVAGGNGYVFETGNPMKTIAVIKKYLAENQPVKTADDSQNDNGNGAATEGPSAQCNPDDGSVLAQIETKDVPAIVRALVTEGVDVFAVRKTENSLEDAFIAITGGGNTVA